MYRTVRNFLPRAHVKMRQCQHANIAARSHRTFPRLAGCRVDRARYHRFGLGPAWGNKSRGYQPCQAWTTARLGGLQRNRPRTEPAPRDCFARSRSLAARTRQRFIPTGASTPSRRRHRTAEERDPALRPLCRRFRQIADLTELKGSSFSRISTIESIAERGIYGYICRN